MVFIVPPPTPPARLNAYLLTDLPAEDLQYLKQRFELGACSRFNPALELVIQPAPASYKDKSHAEIRKAETEAGREDPFVLIDDHAKKSRDGAVWYVTDFADNEDDDDEDNEENDEDEDEDDDGDDDGDEKPLLEILVKTAMLAITHVNDAEANMTIDELLENSESDVWGHEEDESGDDEKCIFFTEVDVVAEPGEFEESTTSELLDNMAPRPDAVVRLKEDVARRNGLVFGGWSAKTPPEEEGEFPEGSVQINTQYDFRFPWPEYTWPEGSL